MDRMKDCSLEKPDAFERLEQPSLLVAPPSPGFGGSSLFGAFVGRLAGFDVLDQPVVADLSACPGQVLMARTTVTLRRAMVGRSVVVVFEGGKVQSPIIMGVIERDATAEIAPEAGVAVQVDGERHLIQAEREIVLRCGEASITLTRAGKVIIKGNYILSRSTGYNKIKGAAIDLN